MFLETDLIEIRKGSQFLNYIIFLHATKASEKTRATRFPVTSSAQRTKSRDGTGLNKDTVQFTTFSWLPCLHSGYFWSWWGTGAAPAFPFPVARAAAGSVQAAGRARQLPARQRPSRDKCQQCQHQGWSRGTESGSRREPSLGRVGRDAVWVQGVQLTAHHQRGVRLPVVSPAKLSHHCWVGREFITSAPLSGLLLGNYPYVLRAPLQNPWELPANACPSPGSGCAPLHLPSQLRASQFRAGEAHWKPGTLEGLVRSSLSPSQASAFPQSSRSTLKARGSGRALNRKASQREPCPLVPGTGTSMFLCAKCC